MAKTRTLAGLRVVGAVLDKVYQTGRRRSQEVKQVLNFVRDSFLLNWNYRLLPQA